MMTSFGWTGGASDKGFARRPKQRVTRQQYQPCLPLRLLAVLWLAAAISVLADDVEKQRTRMVKEIEANICDTRHYLGREALSERVRHARGIVVSG